MEDYQRRVVKEKQELDEKIKDLQSFIESDSFPIKCIKTQEQSSLKEQLRVMYAYSQILKIRINRF